MEAFNDDYIFDFSGVKYHFNPTSFQFQRLESTFHPMELIFHVAEPPFHPMEWRIYRQRLQGRTGTMTQRIPQAEKAPFFV
ncbi:MAG TPA: hypothetical protein DCG33_06450 [Prevotellaceae bacterium]|nr:hypothetical protein [Prevotellaceae bacterium]